MITCAVLGAIFLGFIAAPYTNESRVVFDRRRGVVQIQGSGFPLRKWAVERPLREIAAVDQSRVPWRWGGNSFRVDVIFVDGANYLLCSSVAVLPVTIWGHLARLCQFIAQAV